MKARPAVRFRIKSAAVREKTSDKRRRSFVPWVLAATFYRVSFWRAFRAAGRFMQGAFRLRLASPVRPPCVGDWFSRPFL